MSALSTPPKDAYKTKIPLSSPLPPSSLPISVSRLSSFKSNPSNTFPDPKTSPRYINMTDASIKSRRFSLNIETPKTSSIPLRVSRPAAASSTSSTTASQRHPTSSIPLSASLSNISNLQRSTKNPSLQSSSSINSQLNELNLNQEAVTNSKTPSPKKPITSLLGPKSNHDSPIHPKQSPRGASSSDRSQHSQIVVKSNGISLASSSSPSSSKNKTVFQNTAFSEQLKTRSKTSSGLSNSTITKAQLPLHFQQTKTSNTVSHPARKSLPSLNLDMNFSTLTEEQLNVSPLDAFNAQGESAMMNFQNIIPRTDNTSALTTIGHSSISITARGSRFGHLQNSHDQQQQQQQQTQVRNRSIQPPQPPKHGRSRGVTSSKPAVTSRPDEIPPVPPLPEEIFIGSHPMTNRRFRNQANARRSMYVPHTTSMTSSQKTRKSMYGGLGLQMDYGNDNLYPNFQTNHPDRKPTATNQGTTSIPSPKQTVTPKNGTVNAENPMPSTNHIQEAHQIPLYSSTQKPQYQQRTFSDVHHQPSSNNTKSQVNGPKPNPHPSVSIQNTTRLAQQKNVHKSAPYSFTTTSKKQTQQTSLSINTNLHRQPSPNRLNSKNSTPDQELIPPVPQHFDFENSTKSIEKPYVKTPQHPFSTLSVQTSISKSDHEQEPSPNSTKGLSCSIPSGLSGSLTNRRHTTYQQQETSKMTTTSSPLNSKPESATSASNTQPRSSLSAHSSSSTASTPQTFDSESSKSQHIESTPSSPIRPGNLIKPSSTSVSSLRLSIASYKSFTNGAESQPPTPTTKLLSTSSPCDVTASNSSQVRTRSNTNTIVQTSEVSPYKSVSTELSKSSTNLLNNSPKPQQTKTPHSPYRPLNRPAHLYPPSNKPRESTTIVNTESPADLKNEESKLRSKSTVAKQWSNFAGTNAKRLLLSPFSSEHRRASHAAKNISSKFNPQSNRVISLGSKNELGKVQAKAHVTSPSVLKPTGIRTSAKRISESLSDHEREIEKIMRSLNYTLPDSDKSQRRYEEAKKSGNLICEPMTPSVAARTFRLNMYEKGEILDFRKVYFCGRSDTKKISGDIRHAVNNYGFDDKNGDYRVVPGDHIGYRYEILNVLGKGSFGKVLKCIDHKTGKLVAVKMIINRKRFHLQAIVEAEILQTLSQWDSNDKYHLVKYTQHFNFREHLCICTELLGINLYELIKLNKFHGLPVKLVRHFTQQILEGLRFLDNKEIIHCDLKPENILLEDPLRGKVKIIDFGSSCFESEKVYTYIQSRFYRSPEVILGMVYNRKIDIWSMGCIVAELLTGQPLFMGENEQEQIACIMEVLGVPDLAMISLCSRRKLFFDYNGNPKIHTSSKNVKRYPGTRSLKKELKTQDDSLVDFILQSLTWNPKHRMSPYQGLHHEFITGVPPPAPPAPVMSGRSSANSIRSRKSVKSNNSIPAIESPAQNGYRTTSNTYVPMKVPSSQQQQQFTQSLDAQNVKLGMKQSSSMNNISQNVTSTLVSGPRVPSHAIDSNRRKTVMNPQGSYNSYNSMGVNQAQLHQHQQHQQQQPQQQHRPLPILPPHRANRRQSVNLINNGASLQQKQSTHMAPNNLDPKSEACFNTTSTVADKNTSQNMHAQPTTNHLAKSASEKHPYGYYLSDSNQNAF